MALYRQNLGGFIKEATHDGIGIGGGFIAGGVVGRQVENMLIKNPVTVSSPLSDKLFAWAANNGAKAVLYILMKTYDADTSITKAAANSLAGAAVYDTILRLANKGVNPADISIGGYRIMGGNGMDPAQVQRLVQENSILRTELNKAVQRLAGISSVPGKFEQRGPGSAQDFRYAGSDTPAVAERKRKFGSVNGMEEMGFNVRGMPNTEDVYARQRRYGAMPFEQNPEKTARQRRFGAMEEMGFRPDVKDTSAAKMFNMH